MKNKTKQKTVQCKQIVVYKLDVFGFMYVGLKD